MEDSDLQSTQSGAVIGSNDDLLTEILVRLPLTSILRFKLVSKQWRLLLSHQHFTHRYDINTNLFKSPGLFVSTIKPIFSVSRTRLAGDIYVSFDIENNSTNPFGSCRINAYFNRSNVRIIQSCNGLLLCSSVHNGATEYHVFNPTTKQLILIPSVPKNIRSVALAFHQTDCVHYKVVCICALKPSGDLFQIQVYSSDTRKWNICIESFSAQNPVFRRPVYWNGAIYWAPYTRNDLLYFKLDVEQLQMLPLPAEMMSYETRIMYFGESRGHLHLVFHTDGEEYILRVNVYEMLMDHSGWFVKYRLQLDTLLRYFPCLIFQYERPGDLGEMEYPFQCDFLVVDVVRGKEEEETFLVLATRAKMIRYNIYGKSFKELYSLKHVFGEFLSFHRYIEALSYV